MAICRVEAGSSPSQFVKCAPFQLFENGMPIANEWREFSIKTSGEELGCIHDTFNVDVPGNRLSFPARAHLETADNDRKGAVRRGCFPRLFSASAIRRVISLATGTSAGAEAPAPSRTTRELVVCMADGQYVAKKLAAFSGLYPRRS
jgi:hypothetical protein